MLADMNQSSFRNRQIWVVGDSILDVYLCGTADRISPEGPVPVVHVTERRSCLGGAANVAHNAVAMGADVALFGVLGDDSAGRQLSSMAAEARIRTELVVLPDRPTVTKTRVMVGTHHVVRLDEEICLDLPSAVEEELLQRLAMAPIPDVVIVSDYQKGVVSRRIINSLMELVPRPLLIVDPKGRDFAFYRDCDFITPNELETCAWLGSSPKELLRSKHVNLLLGCVRRGVLITRGARGMTLIENGQPPLMIPSKSLDIVDSTGAGDTAVAAFAVSLASNLPPTKAAVAANWAASFSTSRFGANAVAWSELNGTIEERPTIASSKLFTLEQAQRLCREAQGQGRRVVFTNGCFDIFHPGHAHLLFEASRLGDILIVGLNSDESVRRLKGSGRPVVTELGRALTIASLPCVFAVVVFPENTPELVISRVRPDVLVKGGDYRREEIVGAGIVTEAGGDVVIIPRLEHHSTTAILDRLKGASSKVGLGERPSSSA